MKKLVILLAVPLFLFGVWWGYQNLHAGNSTAKAEKAKKQSEAKAKLQAAAKEKAKKAAKKATKKILVMKECNIVLAVSGMS